MKNLLKNNYSITIYLLKTPINFELTTEGFRSDDTPYRIAVYCNKYDVTSLYFSIDEIKDIYKQISELKLP